MVKPFSVLFTNGIHHGLIASVALPPDLGEIPESVMVRLRPEERKVAQTLKGFRQIQWVGGRLAARAALRALGYKAVAVLSDPFGAPVCTDNANGHALSISITHKRTIAIALAARAIHGSIGVDLETVEPTRPGVAAKVLTKAELHQIEQLAVDRQWAATVVRFAIKESIYKALAPTLKRYIGFTEAEVEPDVDGTATVRLDLTEGEAPQSIDARYRWTEHGVLATVRVQWG